MLVQIESIEFAFFGHAQQSGGIDRVHDRQGDPEGSQGDACASDCLGDEHLRSTAVEKAFQRGRVVGTGWARYPVLAAGEQSKRERSPDAANAMHRDRADGIVNSQPLQQLDPENHDPSSYASQEDGASRSDPVTRASDSYQSGEKSVGGEAC